MRRAEEQIRRLAAFVSALMISAAEALAQENAVRPARRVLVSIPDRKLAVVESDRIVKIFNTAVGAAASPSPSGVFQIVTSISNPTWYTKGRTVPPGPSNPLGPHWLGLSLKGYGIHGTNAPASIGHNASHGCIRLRNQDVQELARIVAVGDQVELYLERTPELERIFAPAREQTIMAAGAAQVTAGPGTISMAQFPR
jgi:lipoprotein-anchoring transpeptidase ErfK/SrfK